MRTYILCCIYLLGLTSCVNYYGTKQTSTPLTETDLSRHQIYHLANKKSVTSEWWGKFHDTQLNELITIGLADSPTMQIAQGRLRKAQQLTEETSASLWPSIDASGSLQRERFSKYGLVPPPFNGETFNIAQLGLNFNYEFDFWGKNRQLVAASVSEQYAAAADLAQTKLILSAAIAAVYFQLQSDSSQLHIAQQIQHQQKEILGIVQAREQHGVESYIPVTTAISNLEAAQLTTTQLAAAEKLSHHQLAILLGKNPIKTEIAINQFSYRQHHVRIPASLPANLLAKRPDIYSSRMRTEAAAHKINVAKARFFPNINLNTFFSYQSIKTGQLFNPASQNNGIAGAIDLPIFDAGVRRANLGTRYAEYDIAVNDYNQAILVALREVADQLAILKSIRSQIRTHANSLAATEKKYNLTSSRYKHGIVDYTQLLESKNLLLQQRAAQIDLQTRHLQAVVAMMKALGGNS